MGANSVVTATCGLDLTWHLTLVLPSASLRTQEARALLPRLYPRAAAVSNLQRVALLVSAFALNRPELLRVAMEDSLHQPYRMLACPLLPLLLPLRDHPGVLGVALSGAGPAVLIISAAPVAGLETAIRDAAGDPTLEILATRISGGASDRS